MPLFYNLDSLDENIPNDIPVGTSIRFVGNTPIGINFKTGMLVESLTDFDSIINLDEAKDLIAKDFYGLQYSKEISITKVFSTRIALKYNNNNSILIPSYQILVESFGDPAWINISEQDYYNKVVPAGYLLTKPRTEHFAHN